MHLPLTFRAGEDNPSTGASNEWGTAFCRWCIFNHLVVCRRSRSYLGVKSWIHFPTLEKINPEGTTLCSRVLTSMVYVELVSRSQVMEKPHTKYCTHLVSIDQHALGTSVRFSSTNALQCCIYICVHAAGLWRYEWNSCPVTFEHNCSSSSW